MASSLVLASASASASTSAAGAYRGTLGALTLLSARVAPRNLRGYRLHSCRCPLMVPGSCPLKKLPLRPYYRSTLASASASANSLPVAAPAARISASALCGQPTRLRPRSLSSTLALGLGHTQPSGSAPRIPALSTAPPPDTDQVASPSSSAGRIARLPERQSGSGSAPHRPASCTTVADSNPGSRLQLGPETLSPCTTATRRVVQPDRPRMDDHAQDHDHGRQEQTDHHHASGLEPQVQSLSPKQQPGSSNPPCQAIVIDGRAVARGVLEQTKSRIDRIKIAAPAGFAPTLVIIQVGSRPDSTTYVRKKQQAASDVGIECRLAEFPEKVEGGQKTIEQAVENLNKDPGVHGIILQLPLPPEMDPAPILGLISPEKDVDGISNWSLGALIANPPDFSNNPENSKKSNKSGTSVNSSAPAPPQLQNAAVDAGPGPATSSHTHTRESPQPRWPGFIPCTPAGVMELLKQSNTPIVGARAVVLGRSVLVGAPIAMLLTAAGATVSVCHSRSGLETIRDLVSHADILVSATGVAGLVHGQWIMPGAVVIDVGTTPVLDPSKKTGYSLKGDVRFDEACTRARAITPVPGGVGPCTVAMLLRNVSIAAERALLLESR